MRRELDVDMIEMSFDVIYCIKHEKSGLLFRFSDYDAICKWYQEKHPGVKHGIEWVTLYLVYICFDFEFNCYKCVFSLPTYLSPFSPSLGYDSAYIGNIMLQVRSIFLYVCFTLCFNFPFLISKLIALGRNLARIPWKLISRGRMLASLAFVNKLFGQTNSILYLAWIRYVTFLC